uniref:MAM domain-containing protein n=1 Tax=Timema shepardi TaxID=629360 RepID=A0A7R9B230_TIMSH|nr:unnamed protein product [Timema shepardi]
MQDICDFGSENDLITCDWVNRNGSSLQWQAGAGTLANWLGGPTVDAGSGDDSERDGRHSLSAGSTSECLEGKEELFLASLGIRPDPDHPTPRGGGCSFLYNDLDTSLGLGVKGCCASHACWFVDRVHSPVALRTSSGDLLMRVCSRYGSACLSYTCPKLLQAASILAALGHSPFLLSWQ